jgi:hypothetical protein
MRQIAEASLFALLVMISIFDYRCSSGHVPALLVKPAPCVSELLLALVDGCRNEVIHLRHILSEVLIRVKLDQEFLVGISHFCLGLINFSSHFFDARASLRLRSYLRE